MEQKKQNLWIFFSAFFIFILIAAVIFLFFLEDKPAETKDKAVRKVAGKAQQKLTKFYYANGGTWKMLDPVSYVLKEKKFVSSDAERESYLAKKVEAGGILRILSGNGRWKEVHVLRDGTVIASGWIDAHNIKKVEEVISADPE